MLSQEDKKNLLILAQSTLESYVKFQKKPTLEILGIASTPSFQEPRGVFVTLYLRTSHGAKNLRGCIGTLQPLQPLFQAVIENTINACSRDSRFIKVREEELSNIFLEINVLTVPCVVASYRDIRLGVDGIILSCQGRQAVFLPSVAMEWNWTLEETLSHLAQKAGLSAAAWKELGARFKVFQSEVFSE